MEIFFGVQISDKADYISKASIQVQDLVNSVIENSSYGSSLKKLHIGLICVAPEYRQFHTVRKPRYSYETMTDEKGKLNKRVSGIEYEIFLDYDSYIELDRDSVKAKLIADFFSSLDILESDAVKKKIGNFDVDKFKVDLSAKLK